MLLKRIKPHFWSNYQGEVFAKSQKRHFFSFFWKNGFLFKTARLEQTFLLTPCSNICNLPDWVLQKIEGQITLPQKVGERKTMSIHLLPKQLSMRIQGEETEEKIYHPTHRRCLDQSEIPPPPLRSDQRSSISCETSSLDCRLLEATFFCQNLRRYCCGIGAWGSAAVA